MPQTKARGTRYQPTHLYLAAIVLATVSGALNFGEYFLSPWRDSICAALSGPSKVQWRTQEMARLEAVQTHKPILYFVSVREDNDSLRMETEIFNDARAAELINTTYIPSKISISRRDYLKVPTALKSFNELYNLPTRASLIAVPARMIDVSSNDLASSANLMELGIDDTTNLEEGNRYAYNNYKYRSQHGQFGIGARASTYSGYINKQDVLDYLYTARLWHQLPPTRGKVAWLGTDTLEKPLGDKPRLIALIDDIGSSSDSCRLDVFWSKRITHLLNKNFESVLVEFKHGDAKHNEQFNYLKEKYATKGLPVLIVEGKALKAPLVQYSAGGTSGTYDFLSAALKPANESEKDFNSHAHGVRMNGHHVKYKVYPDSHWSGPQN